MTHAGSQQHTGLSLSCERITTTAQLQPNSKYLNKHVLK